ncbi:hypothetical protein AURDEDRAFT_157522 [Auricularia subglabra TFB-10046 SS5]|nr:hypothetical protein AURDEDRAFT_157522 [Auricularia subglabra TFB-10046 SS5]
MSRASGSGAGPSRPRGSGPGPGQGSSGPVRREPRAIGHDRCRDPDCDCRNFWAIVSIDALGNVIPSSIDLTLTCILCNHLPSFHLPNTRPARAPDLAPGPIPHYPPTSRCDEDGCLCLMFVFASRQDGDLLPRFVCRCGHKYGNHLRLQSSSGPGIDHRALLAAAFPDPQPEPLRSFQTYDQLLDEPQGSTNSRRIHSFINHRIKGPSGAPAAGVVGPRPGPRLPSTGRVAQQRGTQRAANATTASQPYATSRVQKKKAVGRPATPKVIKGRLVIFPIDLSDEDHDWCPSQPHPSNVDLDVYSSQYLIGPDFLPTLASRLEQFDLAPEFCIEGEQAEKGFLADAVFDVVVAHLNAAGIQIHSTYPGLVNEHLSKLRLLTTVKSSRKLAFRAVARPSADVTVIDLKKHCLPRDKDSFYVFVCPRGIESYLIAQVHKLPTLRTDATSIVVDILHHCFSVRVWDAISDLVAQNPPAIAGRCMSICQRMLSNHALSSLGGWKSTTPALQPSSQAVASSSRQPLFLESDAADQDMEEVLSYLSGPSSSVSISLPSPVTRALSPPISFAPSARSVISSPALHPATPAPSMTLDSWYPVMASLNHFSPTTSSSAAPASSSTNAYHAARPPTAALRAGPSTYPSLRHFETEYGLEPSPPRELPPQSQPFAFDALWAQAPVALQPAPAPSPATSLPFGGAALLAQLASQNDIFSVTHAFDMTAQTSHPAGDPSSDSSSDDSDSDDEDPLNDAFAVDDHHDDQDSNMDEDPASPAGGPANALPPVLDRVDHTLWLAKRDAFDQRLLETIPIVQGTLRFCYYPGRNLSEHRDGRVPLGDILHFLFKSMVERDTPRSPARLTRMVTQKFPLAQISLSGFSPCALFGPSYAFEVGVASGDGVRDAFIATAMDQFTSKAHWRTIRNYKVPFLLPYGQIEPDDIADLKAAGLITAWAIVQAKIIPIIHPALIFLFAASKLLNRSLRDESLLALLVDPLFVRAIDPVAYEALSLWPDSHDKPIPPLLDPTNAALATLHEWLGELNLPVDTVRSRSFHYSFTLGLYSHALVGINLGANEVPRGWDIYCNALDFDLSMTDYPIAATPLTQLFFKPFGLRDTEQQEIYNMKLLIIGLAGMRPTSQGVISRVRYETFVAQHDDDEDLPVVFSRMFDRYISRPGHPAPVPQELRGEDPNALPPPDDVVQAVRPTLFASVLTGWNSMPCVSIGASRTSLAFIFRFIYIDDPAPHIVNPLAPPLSVHVCTRTIDIRVNKPFREMIARSAATLRHAAEQAAGDQSVDTEFDLYFHSQLLLEARAHFNSV